jgi:hypothetical protein
MQYNATCKIVADDQITLTRNAPGNQRWRKIVFDLHLCVSHLASC